MFASTTQTSTPGDRATRESFDHQAAVDADHREHDAKQEAKPHAGQDEAEQVVADVTIGEIHGAAFD